MELQWEVTEAVREMRSESVTSEKRIKMFDEFSRVNRDVFRQIHLLRKTIAARRMENAPPHAPNPIPPRSEAEGILQERRSIILQEVATKRNASNQLSPEARIAAVNRDLVFFKKRIASLRELGRQ